MLRYLYYRHVSSYVSTLIKHFLRPIPSRHPSVIFQLQEFICPTQNIDHLCWCPHGQRVVKWSLINQTFLKRIYRPYVTTVCYLQYLLVEMLGVRNQNFIYAMNHRKKVDRFLPRLYAEEKLYLKPFGQIFEKFNGSQLQSIIPCKSGSFEVVAEHLSHHNLYSFLEYPEWNHRAVVTQDVFFQFCTAIIKFQD